MLDPLCPICATLISPCLEVFDCVGGGVVYIGAKAALDSVKDGINPGCVSLVFDLNAKYVGGVACRPHPSRDHCTILSWDVRRYSSKLWWAESEDKLVDDIFDILGVCAPILKVSGKVLFAGLLPGFALFGFQGGGRGGGRLTIVGGVFARLIFHFFCSDPSPRHNLFAAFI